MHIKDNIEGCMLNIHIKFLNSIPIDIKYNLQKEKQDKYKRMCCLLLKENSYCSFI